MGLEPLFNVSNHHRPSAGIPPNVDDKNPQHYVGHFQNEHGDQCIFVYERSLHQGWLQMGDTNWELRYQINDGNVPELVLDDIEQQWLKACWLAATRLEPKGSS